MSAGPGALTSKKADLENIIDFILTQLHYWGYWVVFAVTFLENSAFVGLVMPGDVTLLVAGLLSSQGTLNLGYLIIIAAGGAILGDSAGYFIGRYGGLRFLRRFGRYFLFKDKYLERAQSYFLIHGGKTILIGRFIMVVKSLAPVVAGISRMPYGIFLLYNVIGSVLSVSLVLLLGYFFGESWKLISSWLGRGGAVAFALVIVAVISLWVYRWWRRRRI